MEGNCKFLGSVAKLPSWRLPRFPSWVPRGHEDQGIRHGHGPYPYGQIYNEIESISIMIERHIHIYI